MVKLNFTLKTQDVWQRLPPSPLPSVTSLPPPKPAENISNTGGILEVASVAEALSQAAESTAADSLSALTPSELYTLAHLPVAGVVNQTLTPRHYQVEAIKYLAESKRRWLTDKPGLGKTLCAAYAADPPVLIACPTYLTNQWYEFLKSCGCDVIIAEGNREQRQKALLSGKPWIIFNIEMMSERKIDSNENEDIYVKYNFPSATTLIVDEAHHIRGRNSSRSKQAADLAHRVERVYLLTATPVYNKPDDMYAQLRMLVPSSFKSYWQFIETYCIYKSTGFGPKVMGARPALRKLFESLSLGRTYKDVGMQLPRLVGQKISVVPDAKFLAEYKRVRDEYLADILNDRNEHEAYEIPNALAVMQHLRRMTAPQKLKPLLEYMRDTDGFTAGTVIFCWYKNTAEQIGTLLGIPVITGDMPPEERVKIAKSEKSMVATISSMSEGVDLSHLKNVVFFELDHVPGRLFQALSRVRRYGGHDVVRVIYLIVKGTIDEVIYKIDEHRTATINEIVREALLLGNEAT